MPVMPSVPSLAPINAAIATAESNIAALQAINAIQRLATVTGINGKTVANTTLYTVPVGKQAIITDVIVRVTASNTPLAALTAGVGVNANADDIFAAVALTGLLNLNSLYRMGVVPLGIVAQAADVIKFGIDVGATATTLTLSVDLIGYLL